jgi:prepilin-type N-terminal cleavage/methylation domain-containing protein
MAGTAASAHRGESIGFIKCNRSIAMKTKQQGFTLIELLVVIVLLGIIGSVATAKFQDLSAQAANAVAQGVAAELSSGSVINYASNKAGGASTAITGTIDCTDGTVDALLQSGLPDDITLADGGTVICVAGGSVECTVSHDDGTTSATATILCTT